MENYLHMTTRRWINPFFTPLFVSIFAGKWVPAEGTVSLGFPQRRMVLIPGIVGRLKPGLVYGRRYIRDTSKFFYKAQKA